MNYLQSISLSVILISFVSVCASIAYFFIRVSKTSKVEPEKIRKVKRKFLFNEILVLEFLRAYKGQKADKCLELSEVNFRGLAIREKMYLFIDKVDRSSAVYKSKPTTKGFCLSELDVIQFVKAICGHKNKYGLTRENFSELNQLEQIAYFNEIVNDARNKN